MSRYKLFPLTKEKDSLYVVAVSGGPDSMFLLEKMRLLKYSFVVCHVNYRKRVNSDYDESLVSDYCRKYHIRLFVCYPVQHSSGNFQANARKQRYDFFFQTATEIATNKIVIAHNFEDSLETYVMQKQRRGMINCWGLTEVTEHKNYLILRPILSFTKKRITNYLQRHSITYATDSSNFSMIYRRNVVRTEIFALSSTAKKAIATAIVNDNYKLQQVIDEFERKRNELLQFESIYLNEHWLASSSEVQTRLLYYWINNYSGNAFIQKKKAIVGEVRKQLLSKKKKIVINLNGGFRINKINDWAFMSKDDLWKIETKKTH